MAEKAQGLALSDTRLWALALPCRAPLVVHKGDAGGLHGACRRCNVLYMDIPARSRGKTYKVQYRDEVSLTWRDIQKRYTGRATAEAAARAYGAARKVEVRLMEIDLDRGQRVPVAL